MPRVRTLVLGVSTESMVHACTREGVDALGFDLSTTLPNPIDPDDAFALTGLLPPFVASVGVFADVEIDAFADVEAACPTVHTLFIGNEDRETVVGCAPVLRTLSVSPALGREVAQWAALDEVSGLVIRLDDAPQPASNWDALEHAMGLVTKPVLVLCTLAQAPEAARRLSPYAVCVRCEMGDVPTLVRAVSASS